MDESLIFELLKQLKEKDLITYFDLKASRTEATTQSLSDLFKQVKKIKVSDGELVYLSDDGEEILCPFVDTAVTDSGWWLSDKIPAPSFDIEQSGNIRMADEAEAAYICTIVAAILDDDAFTMELDSCVKEYDFKTMNGSTTFRELLSSWQDLQSVTINVIVSGAKYAIQNQKKDSELFLLDGLQHEDVAGLRDLGLKIKQINFDYSTGELSPDNVKKLTKIERLQKISERDQVIDSAIANSRFGNLYKVTKLSSDYVSPITKKKILQFCNSEVEKLYSENKALVDKFGDKNGIITKLRRRAIRLATSDVRKQNMLKYVTDKESFKLPRKQ